MSDKTGIEWTDATWNPVTGCSKVSAGCDHCYAETIAHRFAGTKAYPDGFAVTLRPERLDQPLRWKRPRRIFVNSMSDLFHKEIPDEYIARVFAVMAQTPRHTYQILTKRPRRMRSLLRRWTPVTGVPPWVHTGPWPLPNVWLGVSVERQEWAETRIPVLLDTPAAVRFLSCEPLLGPLELTRVSTHQRGPAAFWDGHDQINALTGRPRDEHWHDWNRINWVIVGGESGPGARPMHPDWARSLRDQCQQAKVPFLFKQWGEWGPAPWSVRIPNARSLTRDELAAAKADAEARGATHHIQPSGHLYKPDHKTWSLERDADGEYPGAVRRWGKKAAGRELDGRTWDEYPAVSA